ncbi:MAG: DUF2971 domain-containing protein [Nitrospirota bacterium]
MSDSLPIDEFIKSNDAIFHYTRASVALEEILFYGKFRLSLLKDTNDPWEYKFQLLNMSGWSLPNEVIELYDKAHPVIDRIIRMESRVMCFCSNTVPTIILDTGDTIRDTVVNTIGWNKSRMWAQYGENHRGICLVFSRKAIEAEFANIKEGVITENMQYTTRASIRRNAYTLNGNQLVKDGVENYCYNHIKQHSEALFFTKYIDYRDESEYRVVVFDPNNKYEYIDIKKSIKCVISGDRTPDVYFPLIRQLSDRYGIECRHAYWDRGTPHLVPCKEDEKT